MKTIFIKYQDAQGQYDEDYNQITEWNDKYCSWVVLPKYEDAYNNGEIDWWGDDNDFPSGETMAELQAQYPDADTWPVIGVTWFWDEEGYIREFHEKPKAGRYCKFNETAYKVIVRYNSETIFDGKLE